MTWGRLTENLSVAWESLKAHKVRTGLTVLGIVIGVTSVISVAAIITGLNGFISHRVEQLGSRTYFIMRFSPALRLGRMPEAMRKRKYLNPSDAAYLREYARTIDVATVFSSRPSTPGELKPDEANDISYGGERVERVVLRAVEPDHAVAIPLFAVAQGRFISEYDLERSRDVAVLGDAIAAALFPRVDPIGKQIRVNGKLMEVIGVLEKDPGLFGGPGLDQVACIPLTTFRKYYPETKEYFIAFTAARDVDPSIAVNEVTELMRRLRRVPHGAENDFDVFSPDFLSDLWNSLTSALVALTAAISSVGLLIGGVGVMNIMLISVTERTAEIGVRKAVGARASDIRVQFLLEAMTLSVAGGAIGLGIGATIAFLVRTLIPSVPATLSAFWVAMGLGISIGVGLLFGYYPASRAAGLDPVECLRYE
ncbi:MAG: ABC transporter permease [Bryobacteraceae bacterium]